MFLVDEEGNYLDVFANNKEHLLYKPKVEIIGKNVTDFFDPETSELLLSLVKKAIQSQTLQCLEYELFLSSKKEFFEARVMPTYFKESGNDTVMVVVRDITNQLERKNELENSKAEMKHLATHDSLTDLPNRILIFEHLNHAIAAAKRTGNNGALFFIDIDCFKDINDNYSHQTGDLLLKDLALRLSHITRDSDIVGRLSGDEFLLILENISHMDDILNMIEKIKAQLSTPFSINGLSIEITVSIGVACFPVNGDNADKLIHAADQAMYNVKKNGKDGFTFYTKEFSIISHEYFLIQNALKKAIKEDDFTIVYQPQFSLKNASLTGVEALLRCNSKEVEDIPISRLISIAEESNIIHNISRFVMQRCCRQISEWQELALSPLKIAVNLSRKELSDENLVHMITENLSACNINPGILEFEITESTLLQNNHTAKKNINELRKLGCSFSIDDYGTGFSSLSNLREFDLDKIKIDKSFIHDLEHNNNDKIIVSATINMVKELGLTVLAEGVETEGQEKLLKIYGCDEVQGYLYSQPLNAEKITELLVLKK
jgi:diguanylate cyclase (GGDEF)-like protein